MPIDFSNAWNTGVKIINETISLLPNILLAVLIFFAFLLLGAVGKSLARRWLQRQRKHQGIALLMARLVQTSILILGFLVALSVVAPSFKAGDLIKLLGVGTVAIGFAFQNILQNFLAGILLLLQEPFQLGDFISVIGIEGTVYDIQSRATIVSTKERQASGHPECGSVYEPGGSGVVRRKSSVSGSLNSRSSRTAPCTAAGRCHARIRWSAGRDRGGGIWRSFSAGEWTMRDRARRGRRL